VTRLEDLEAAFPGIAWRTPARITVPGFVVGAMCCRVCIAEQGIVGREVASKSFDSLTQFERHLEDVHDA